MSTDADTADDDGDGRRRRAADGADKPRFTLPSAPTRSCSP